MVTYRINDNISIDLKGKTLAEEQTKFQYITVVETKNFDKIMLIGDNPKDLTVQFSEKDEAFYHEAVVHPVMATHPNPKKILIIGGGDGGVAREVLKHNINSITIVDIDKKVIEFSKKHIPIHQGALDNPKVKIIIGDGKKFIEENTKRYDVIILDLTDPEEYSKLLFTKEFYTKIKERLTSDGAMSVQTSSPAYDAQVLGRVYTALTEVFNTVIPYSSFVPSFFVEESYCLATQNQKVQITKTLKKRKIDLKAYTIEQLDNNLKHKSPYISKILTQKWNPSTDSNPVTHS